MATAREIATQIMAMYHLTEEPAGWYIPDIAKMIPSTIRDIVISIVDGGKPDERKLFVKTFGGLAITPVANDFDTVDLTTPMNAAEPILLDLPFPRVTHVDSQSGELLRIADPANLSYAPINEGFDWYALEGSTLYINAEPELTGTLTIKAFYVPAVANLPKQFESELISRLSVKMGVAAQ
jgi:hypothetical protein